MYFGWSYVFLDVTAGPEEDDYQKKFDVKNEQVMVLI